jgi:nucleoside 2-deoxyribosyltransferase
MKIYVAANWDDIPRVKALYERLRAWGHTITCDWTPKDLTTPSNSSPNKEAVAELDWDGVETADLFIFLLHPTKDPRGSMFELGEAMTLRRLRHALCRILDVPVQKPVILAVGDKDRHIFYHLPEIQWFQDDGDLLHYLEQNEVP